MEAEAFKHELLEAVLTPDARGRLRSLAQRQLQLGAGQDELVQAVEDVRPQVTDAQEDELLALLDAITGWCSPQVRLDS